MPNKLTIEVSLVLPDDYIEGAEIITKSLGKITEAAGNIGHCVFVTHNVSRVVKKRGAKVAQAELPSESTPAPEPVERQDEPALDAGERHPDAAAVLGAAQADVDRAHKHGRHAKAGG